jgi:hypothetical protein
MDDTGTLILKRTASLWLAHEASRRLAVRKSMKDG